MANKVLSIPEEALITMLKALPEDTLIEIFWKTLLESDTSPLTNEEKESLEKGKKEFEKGETIRWNHLR